MTNEVDIGGRMLEPCSPQKKPVDMKSHRPETYTHDHIENKTNNSADAGLDRQLLPAAAGGHLHLERAPKRSSRYVQLEHAHQLVAERRARRGR